MIRHLISEGLIKPLLHYLTKGKQPRVIYDRSGQKPYLSRFYIIGRPYMTDGSSPFNLLGNPKKEAVFPNNLWGLYLHRFHASDEGEELHSHPWKWALSFILVGGYVEERRQKASGLTGKRSVGWVVRSRAYEPLSFNFIRDIDFHRVDLFHELTELLHSIGRPEEPPRPEPVEAWSLFLVGPRAPGWCFWNRETGMTTPWRQFLDEWREKVNGIECLDEVADGD